MIFAIEGAYFELQTHGQYDPFVFELTDATKIEQARKILDGSETSTIHVMGRIKKTPKPYNPRYSFHIDPDTINFFDHAIEVCDANTAYVEENLDEVCGAFLPGMTDII